MVPSEDARADAVTITEFHDPPLRPWPHVALGERPLRENETRRTVTVEEAYAVLDPDCATCMDALRSLAAPDPRAGDGEDA